MRLSIIRLAACLTFFRHWPRTCRVSSTTTPRGPRQRLMTCARSGRRWWRRRPPSTNKWPRWLPQRRAACRQSSAWRASTAAIHSCAVVRSPLNPAAGHGTPRAVCDSDFRLLREQTSVQGLSAKAARRCAIFGCTLLLTRSFAPTTGVPSASNRQTLAVSQALVRSSGGAFHAGASSADAAVRHILSSLTGILLRCIACPNAFCLKHAPADRVGYLGYL